MKACNTSIQHTQEQEYKPGISLIEASRYIRAPPENIIKLNANENLFVPQEFMLSIAKEAIEEVDYRLYPNGLVDEVCEKLANYLKVDKDNILLGCGSDQLIDLLMLTFGRSGVTTIHPTFTYYYYRCKLHGIPYRYTVFNRDLTVNTHELSRILEKSSMFILCNPNNPLGHVVSENIIREIAETFKGIVVLDEAYAEFSTIQLHKLPLELNNVIIVRTFSKSFAAASIRLGYIVGPAEVINTIRKFQQPYPVSGFSLKFASLLLDRIEYFRRVWNEVKRVRDWFYKELKKYSKLHVFPSQANFVSFGCNIECERVSSELLKRGYIVRVFSNILGFKCLVRVTLAPINILKGFIKALTEVVN